MTSGALTLEGLEDFHGAVIAPDDDGYEQARKVWNASIDRRPALVVRPAGVADVQAALRYAAERGLLVAVRAGAHSVAGFSTCDGGLVIDLSTLKGIRVDPAARRAHVQPGVVWKELDRETQAFGLAVTGGLISSTGVAGFTLGGGIGWLQRSLGLACDNLVSADLVTADGGFVHVDDRTDPELMWGLRGGGGNFGIVTSFEFQLHAVGPEIYGGLVMFPGARAAEVLSFFRDFAATVPEELMLAPVLRLAPPAPFLPEEVHGKPVIALVGVHTDPDRAQRDLEPVRDLGEPLADVMIRRPYTQMQAMLDASWTPGFQNYWKADYMVGLPDDAIAVLAAYLETITSPLSDFKLPLLGGAVARVDEDATAYSHRDAPFILNINARWSDAADSERHIEWTRALFGAMQPFSAGATYTNFMSADDGAERVRQAYGEKFPRLQALKDRLDPDNVFSLNQNVPPSGTAEPQGR